MNKSQDPQTSEHEDDEDFDAESEGSDSDAADFDFGPTQQGNYEFGDLNYWTNSPFPWFDRFLTTSKECFGLDSFPPYQKGAMNATLSKRDVFLIIPNDGNKGLTYQLPSLLDEGATVVFMPLIETMQDQTTQLTKKNIYALNLSGAEGVNVNLTSVFSEYGEKQKESVSKDAKKYPRIIFLSPEQLTSSETIPPFLKELYQRGLIQRFVVDGAQCISSLSREFRKEYLNLNKLKADFPGIPILGMTATEDLRNDIIQQLGMKDALSFQYSFNRANLVFEVRAKDKRTCTDQIAQFIKAEYPGKTGIIYTTSIKDAVKVSDELKSKFGIKSAFYHSQMLKEPRINAENAWEKGDIDVIVATASFGVSLNKPNVRFIIHYNPTRSLKHYYQQVGLVGKDGLKSHCIIYYHPKEKRAVEFFIGKSGDSQQVKRQYVVELFLLLKYCEDQYTCRRALLLSYFGERFDREECNGMCDNCQAKKQPTMKDMTVTVQKIVGFFNQHPGEDFPLDRLPRMLIGSGRKYKDLKVIDEKLNRDEIMAILKEMIVAKYLVIDFKVVKKRKHDSLEPIVRLDKSKASILLEGKDRLTMQYPFYAHRKIRKLESDGGRGSGRRERKPREPRESRESRTPKKVNSNNKRKAVEEKAYSEFKSEKKLKYNQLG